MNTKTLAALGAVMALAAVYARADHFGTALTYQGRLAVDGNPANGSYDLKFTLYDAASGGNAVAGPITNSPVNVTNGLFTTPLDFGVVPFAGDARWLDIAVQTNGGTVFTPLVPRQPLTPAPYALYAPGAGTAATAVIATAVAANGVGNASLQANAVTGDKVANGSLTAGDVNAASFSNTFWKVDGNVGTTAGTHFLGTPDNQPLEIKVNGLRALRLEPTALGLPNVIEGASNNAVAPGVSGATIGGGGDAGGHQVTADFGTIGGGRVHRVDGYGSTIGGGQANTISSNCAYSTIAGGWSVTLDPHASYVAVGGGSHHGVQTNADYATIGGGYNQVIGSNALYATIAGGAQNAVAASVKAGFIAGGQSNRVAGDFGFAAGRRAQANHRGAFVWADSADVDFASTAANQFLIRAAGGVGVNKTSPGSALDVNGTATATAFAGDGANLTSLNASSLGSGTVPSSRLAGTYGNPVSFNNAANSFAGNGAGLTSLNAGNLATGTVADGRLSANVALRSGGNAFSGNQTVTAGNVGIGTTTPQSPLDLDLPSSDAYIRLRSGGVSWPVVLHQSAATSTFTVTNGGQARLAIQANGNVGIGTPAPTRKLHVTETSASSLTYPTKLANEGDTANTAVGLLFQVDAGGDRGKGGLIYERTSTWNRGDFHFLQNAAADSSLPTKANAVVTVANNGDVGLRTTAPQAALDINRPSGDAAVRLTSGASWPLVLSQSPTSDFTITNGGQPRVTIRPGGNVGIGTTSPAAKLHVAGDAQIDGNLAYAGVGGVNWGQTRYDGRTITTNWVVLDEFGVLKPADGFLVIMGNAEADMTATFSLGLFDVTGQPTELTSVTVSGAQYVPYSILYYRVAQTAHLTWVLPVTAGGYINLSLRCVVWPSGEATVGHHNLTVMFFPRRLN